MVDVKKDVVDDELEVAVSPEILDEQAANKFAVEHDGETIDDMLDDIEYDDDGLEGLDFLP